MASSSSNQQRFPKGTISELFNFPTAAVMLLDYDDKQSVRLLKMGDFHLRVAVQTAPPLMMTTTPPLMTTFCSVDQFQWGIAKDAPIIRMTERSFVFGFPGHLYALQFPPVCHESQLLALESVFVKFGHYINFFDPASGEAVYLCPDNEPKIWDIVRPLAELKAHEVLDHFGHIPGRLVDVSPQMISCYTRALRMSSATKAIVYGLVSGTLTPVHITVLGTDSGGSLYLMPAPPSISVFTSIVDAIEVAWMCSMGVPAALTDSNADSYFPGFRIWKLSGMGIMTYAKGLESANNKIEELMKAVKTEIGDGDDNDKEKEGSSEGASSSKNNASMVHGKGKAKA